tara:strand:- start:2193 stop:2666 length:474 start_codon:yes stop_codon:yes gene_type:complete
MATLIIETVSKNVMKVCLTDAQVAAQNIQPDSYGPVYTKITIDDAEALAMCRSKKVVANISAANEVTYEDLEMNDDISQPKTIINQEDFDSSVSEVTSIINTLLKVRPTNAMAAEVTAYKDALAGIDSGAITYPVANSFEGYIESLGIAPLHPLQIP